MLKRLTLVLAFALAACSGNDIKDFRTAEPKLDIREYFTGRLVAFGTVTDYGGEVTDRLFVEMDGSWEGNNGLLKEHFRYSDGTTEDRTWQLTVSEDGKHVTGKREDVIGEAKGDLEGNALFMKYTIKRPHKGDIAELTADDRLYLIDGPYLVNEIRFKKFGVTVSTVNLGFHRLNEFIN